MAEVDGGDKVLGKSDFVFICLPPARIIPIRRLNRVQWRTNGDRPLPAIK